MPIIVDVHHGSELPPLDSIRGFLRQARLAICDEFGVRGLDLYCGEGGRVCQVLATRRANTGLTDEQRALVRRMIVAAQTWASRPFDPDAEDEWLIQVG
jgi:hypothetical protein